MLDLDTKTLNNIDIVRVEGNTYISLDNSFYLPIDEELSEITQLPIEDLEKKPNWIYANGDCYYYKEIKSLLAFTNELLGQYFSEYMGLPTIKYEVVTMGGKIVGLISKNFKSSDYKYCDSVILSKREQNRIKGILTDKEDVSEFKRLLTLYLVRNYYSSTKDRNTVNSLYTVDRNNNIGIAPLYDYEQSFLDFEMEAYVDPLISWSFNPESTSFMRENNIFFEQAVNLALSFDIKTSLETIEEQRGIKLPKELIDFYQFFEKERKEFVANMGFIKEDDNLKKAV